MTDVKKHVDTLLSKYSVKQPPVRVEKIAESEGVNVVFLDFDDEVSGKLHGYYDHGEKTIVVNAADSAEEKQYTIAHELGHHLMHAEYAAGEGYVPRMKFHVENEQENQADRFADSLLAPSTFAPAYASLLCDSDFMEMFLVTEDTLKRVKETF